MSKKFLVTAALPYANGYLHVGHIAGAYLPADIFVRYQRAVGSDIMFVCGSDDNGVPITLSAAQENKTPADIVATYNKAQKEAFTGLGIEFDVYGGTHHPDFVDTHTDMSQHIFKACLDNGFLSKRKTKQHYDADAKMFLPDRYVKGTCHHCDTPGALGDQCENCGKTTDPLLLKDPVSVVSGATPEVRETTHWFFELEKFRPRLKEWLDTKEHWRPAVLNFARGLLDQELPARSITRDLKWGIPVPVDDVDAEGKVLYVWFDAPIGYVSFTSSLCKEKYGDASKYEEWWKSEDCQIVHFIGEDNTVFHAIIWPAMLMGEGTFQLPSHVVANCYLNVQMPGKEETEKMSKSQGTGVWVHEYLKDFDPDPLRYYLTATAPEGTRTAIDIDDLIARNNGELLNAFGNFFNRTMTFAHKYFDGKVPPEGRRDSVDAGQLQRCAQAAERTAALLEQCRFKAALSEVMALARAGNGYFDATKPFISRKTDMKACARAINVCLQTAGTLATITAPFLPATAKKCAGMLNLDGNWRAWSSAVDELPGGHPLGEPEILIKKLDAGEVFSR